jgi:hypothetical protein
MWILRIDAIELRLHLIAADIASNDRGKISATVADNHDLLCCRQETGDFVLN